MDRSGPARRPAAAPRGGVPPRDAKVFLGPPPRRLPLRPGCAWRATRWRPPPAPARAWGRGGEASGPPAEGGGAVDAGRTAGHAADGELLCARSCRGPRYPYRRGPRGLHVSPPRPAGPLWGAFFRATTAHSPTPPRCRTAPTSPPTPSSTAAKSSKKSIKRLVTINYCTYYSWTKKFAFFYWAIGWGIPVHFLDLIREKIIDIV